MIFTQLEGTKNTQTYIRSGQARNSQLKIMLDTIVLPETPRIIRLMAATIDEHSHNRNVLDRVAPDEMQDEVTDVVVSRSSQTPSELSHPAHHAAAVKAELRTIIAKSPCFGYVTKTSMLNITPGFQGRPQIPARISGYQ